MPFTYARCASTGSTRVLHCASISACSLRAAASEASPASPRASAAAPRRMNSPATYPFRRK
eukprot:2124700-Rhodomonas_salina.1